MKFGFRRPRVISSDVQLPQSHADAHGHPHNCLNCGEALMGAYCHQCGQSASTHRMSFAHFLLHDFVHGVWHLDKGFPAMFQKAFVNPGKNIRAYLSGKRVGWFSILTLIFILLAVTGVVEHQYRTDKPNYFNDFSRNIGEFLNHNTKWLLLGLCFVCSWSSALVFRRPRLNLSEHTVMNAFFLVGMLTIALLSKLANWALVKAGVGEYRDVTGLLIIVYLSYAYYTAFRKDYRFWAWLWRYLLHGFFSVFIITLLVVGALAFYARQSGVKTFELELDPPDSSIAAPHVAPPQAAH